MEIIVGEAIKKGLNYLKNEQGPDGSFGFETIFPMVLIFDCLNEIETKTSQKIKIKIKDNLLNEKSENWSFNYWKKNSEKFKNEPYPDDLDDTCCALAALNRFDKKIINGNALSKIVNLLLISEEKEGGPYRTWILPKEKSGNWDDIDLAVNSNVAYFLKLQEVELQNIKDMIEKCVTQNKILSPFYKGDLPIIYFISRFYRGKCRENIKCRLKKRLNKKLPALDLALIISSLIRMGYIKEINPSWIDWLINKQMKNGAWVSGDFYFYINKKTNNQFIGDKSISTAFAIEALSLYLKAKKNNLLINKEGLALKKIIKKKIIERFGFAPFKLRKQIIKVVNTITENDKQGIITNTPLLIFKSLPKFKQKLISKEFLIKLGEINLLGWCAYKIYDGIIDGDVPKNQLPLANIICREMEIEFNSLEILSKTGFFKLCHETLQSIEISNWQEIETYRFSKNTEKIMIETFDFEMLAKRSMGHALTSVAMLCKLGLKVESEEVGNLWQYFKYFIVSRQMNDDAHDWFEDFFKGQINSANHQIISEFKGVIKDIKDYETNKLKTLFWEKVIPKFSRKTIKFAKKAEKYLEKLKIVNKKFLLELNQKNVLIAKRALEESQKTLKFIENYYS